MATFTNDTMRAQIVAAKGGAFSPLGGSVPFADPDSRVGVRDPSLARVRGRYLLAYTRAPRSDVLGHESTWGLAVSRDLRSFRRVAVVRPQLPGGIFTLWAPDLFVDGDTLYCYWTGASRPGAEHQTYVQHASASGFTRWSRPTLVRGLGANVIDFTVRRARGRFVGVVKDEDAARLHLAWATNPAGPFALDWTALPTGPERVEGPSLAHSPSGAWLLVFDPFDTNRLRFMSSRDLRRWSAPADVAASERGLRHPSLLWLSRS